MKTVNPYETNAVVSPIYCGAKAPLFIAHSTEELEQINTGVPYTLIHNVLELVDLIKASGYVNPYTNYSVQDLNWWLPTGEIYVPDIYTSNGMILYLLIDGKPVVTDNCYIQVLGLAGHSNKFTLATSAGLINVSAMDWSFSAALRVNFKVSTVLKQDQVSNYQAGAERAIQGNRPRVGDLRFIYYTLFSDMDIYVAAKKAYGRFMTKERTDQLRNTDRIKKLIAKELSMIIPNLAEEILKKYPIEEIAGDMKEVVKKTIDAKEFNHKNAIEALTFVLDNSVKAPAVLSAPQSQPLVDGRIVQTIGETSIHSATQDVMSLMKKKDETEKAVVLNETEYRKAETDLAVPHDGYVMATSPGGLPEPDKLFPDDDKP